MNGERWIRLALWPDGEDSRIFLLRDVWQVEYLVQYSYKNSNKPYVTYHTIFLFCIYLPRGTKNHYFYADDNNRYGMYCTYSLPTIGTIPYNMKTSRFDAILLYRKYHTIPYQTIYYVQYDMVPQPYSAFYFHVE